jgi:hypothetical protein
MNQTTRPNKAFEAYRRKPPAVQGSRWKSQYNVKDNPRGPFPYSFQREKARCQVRPIIQALKRTGSWDKGQGVHSSLIQSDKCATEEWVHALGKLDGALGCLAQQHD